MQRLLALTLTLFILQGTHAQDLFFKGTVIDSTTFFSAPKVLVKLQKMRDTLNQTTKTNIDGDFNFQNLSRGFYSLTLSGEGFETKKTFVRLMDNKTETIYIYPDFNTIKKVVVKRETDITVKDDTIQYTADSFKTQANASAEDLVKKLPGVTSENGTVKAQGEEVKRVLVDGKPFFGDDPKAALKNLPAEGIDKVQVFDDKSDKAKFTGFDDGETVKTINIITKPGMRSGIYGRVYGGYGSDNYYQAGLSLTKTNSKGRFSVIGQSNNINQQNFSLDDILGLLGQSGDNMRGRPRGSNGAPMARPGSELYNFYVDNQNGITETNALGLNYAGVLNKKVSVSGSYFINKLENNNIQTTNRNFFGDIVNNQVYKENSTSNSSSLTHRINGRLEYNIDSNNKLIYNPSFTLQDIQSLSKIFGNTAVFDTIINRTTNNNNGNNAGLIFRNNLVYQHKFKTKGQTITLQGNANFNPSNSNILLGADNYFFRATDTDSLIIRQLTEDEQIGTTYNGDVSYTYLLNKKNQLEVSGSYGYNINDRDRINFVAPLGNSEYTQIDTGLSSIFNSITRTIEGGLRIRKNVNKNLIYSYGLSVQETRLNNDQVFPFALEINKPFLAFIPRLFIRYKPSKFNNLFAFYRLRTNVPNVTQLQNVVNNTNPLSLYKGNPNLNQQNTHFLLGRYTNVKPFDGTSFFAFAFVQASQNYIGNSTTIAFQNQNVEGIEIPRGGQLTVPTNLSGFLTSNINLNKSLKIKKLKSNFNSSLGFNGTQTPSLINNIKNYNRNLAFNLILGLSSNISEKLDFNFSAKIVQTFVNNTLQKQLNYNFTAPGFEGKIFWQFYKGWFYETELSYTTFIGLNEEFNTNIFLINPSIGFRTKQNLWEFKLYAFDLLNQNQNISRTTQQTYVEDINSLVIQRYAMVKVLYNIKYFSKKDAPVFQMPERD